jgi:hypothetical protein
MTDVTLMSSRMWMTAALSDPGGACACPVGCDHCAYRSPNAFVGTDANYVALADGLAVFDLLLGENGTSYVSDGTTNLTTCPSVADEVECVKCSPGWMPVLFAGEDHVDSTMPQRLQGGGIQCVFVDADACDPLSDTACGHNFTFTAFGETIGYLLVFFLIMIGIFQALRAVPHFLHTCDPNYFMTPNHPRYPPTNIPPKPPPGAFGWLKRAWRISDTDILNHVTPDELMLLRWFRVMYHYFFGATLFCSPVLMALYYASSDFANSTNGMRRFTLEAASNPAVFWVAIAETWACSFWLMYLLSRETKAYARLIWKLGPNRLGIKSHAVVVNDIPMLTTDPLPESIAHMKDGVGLLSAINSVLSNKGAKTGGSGSTRGTPENSPKFASPSSPFNPAFADLPRGGGGSGQDLEGLGTFGSFRDVEAAATATAEQERATIVAYARARKWMKRNSSAVRAFMDHTMPDELEGLRACTKTEMVQSTKMKLEAVLGEGCVVSCMPARDVRALDRHSLKWQAANERHLQALIREAGAQEELLDAEAEAVRKRGGLGRLPTLKLDDDIDDDIDLDAFDAELGGDEGLPSLSREASEVEVAADLAANPLNDPAVTKLRAKRDWAVKEREAARDALSAALKAFDNARFEYLTDESPSPSMLVVFSRQMDAVIAGQVQVDRNFGSWRTKPAPGPNDVVWHNIALTSEQRKRKNLYAAAFAGAMVVFFSVPVNLLGEVVVGAAGSQSIVSQISVALILIIFLVLGHILSLVLSRQYGHVAISKMDVTGASIYFWLLVLNLFVSNLSTTPLWTELIAWVRQPKLIVDELISKVLNTSSFFLQFCMLRCAQSAPLELIHPPFHLGLAVKTLVHLLRAGEMPTEKMIRNWSEPENTPLHRVPAQTMMVAFLGIMYCVMAPVILPVCGIFFSLFYLFWKHNLCYHYTQPYASGQTLWPWLVKHTYVCLVVSQTILLLGLPTLVGEEYMGVQSVRWMRLVLCPLPILSALEFSRTRQTLRESLKVPVHKHVISELERGAGAAAATAQSGKYDERVGHFDERGVVGDVGKFIKRGLRSPGASAAERRKAEHVNATKENDANGSFVAGASFVKTSGTRSSAVSNDAHGGAERKSSFNSLSTPLETTRRLNLSTEEARSEVQRLIDLGVWRTYQPISIWPQVSEKAAASLIVRRWREKKGVRLRVARRRAEEAFRGLSVASGETTVVGGEGRLVERVGSNA